MLTTAPRVSQTGAQQGNQSCVVAMRSIGQDGRWGACWEKQRTFPTTPRNAVYAPLQREGYFPDDGSLLRTAPPITASAMSPEALEASLPRGALVPRLRLQRQPAQPTYSERQEAAKRADLQLMASLIAAAKAGAAGSSKQLVFPLSEPSWQAASTAATAAGAAAGTAQLQGTAEAASPQACPALCAPTAAPSAPPSALEARPAQAALVLLQRLLRGRAAQVELLAARSARAALIAELRIGIEQPPAVQQPQQVPPVEEAAGELGGKAAEAAVGAALWRVCHALADAGAGQPEQALHILQAIAAQQAQPTEPQRESSAAVGPDGGERQATQDAAAQDAPAADSAAAGAFDGEQPPPADAAAAAADEALDAGGEAPSALPAETSADSGLGERTVEPEWSSGSGGA